MCRRVDDLAETLGVEGALQHAWLQALDLEAVAHEVVLDIVRVAVVERRIADGDNLLAQQIARVGDGERQRRDVVGQAFDFEDRHVPIGMDHPDIEDLEDVSRRRIALEVDAGGTAVDELQIAVTETLGKDLRDMAVGHQQVAPDDEAGAAIGDVGVPQQFDAPDRRQSGFDPLLQCGLAGQLGPQRMAGCGSTVEGQRGEAAVLDVIDWPQLRDDNGFQIGKLLGRDLDPSRQILHAGARQFKRRFRLAAIRWRKRFQTPTGHCLHVGKDRFSPLAPCDKIEILTDTLLSAHRHSRPSPKKVLPK